MRIEGPLDCSIGCCGLRSMDGLVDLYVITSNTRVDDWCWKCTSVIDCGASLPAGRAPPGDVPQLHAEERHGRAAAAGGRLDVRPARRRGRGSSQPRGALLPLRGAPRMAPDTQGDPAQVRGAGGAGGAGSREGRFYHYGDCLCPQTGP